MKRIFVDILIFILIVGLLSGCGSSYIAKPVEPQNPTNNFPNSNELMLEYIVDWSLVVPDTDGILSKTITKVYYDGTISVSAEYNGGHISNQEINSLSAKQTKSLYMFLTTSNIKRAEITEKRPTCTINLFNSDETMLMMFEGVLDPDYQEFLEKYLYEVLYGEDGVLLEISYRAVAPTPDRNDVWESTNWTVYYDGTVEYYDMYKGGPGEVKKDKLTEKELNKLKQFLTSNDNIAYDGMIPEDIPLYDIKTFNEYGEIQLDFWGEPSSEFYDLVFSMLEK